MSSEDYEDSRDLSSDEESGDFKRMKTSKESQIYGVFADDIEDNERSRTSSDLYSKKGVSFVESSEKPQSVNEELSDQEDERPSFSMFSPQEYDLVQNDTKNDSIPDEEFNEEASEPVLGESTYNGDVNFQKPIHKVSKDFGKLGASSSGFGLKFLKKFGYQEGQGLGTKGQGLAEPILPKLRQNQKAGIAHGGISEMDEHTKRLEKQRYNKPDNSSDEENVVDPNSGRRNRRVKFKKTKTQFKSFKETLLEINQKHSNQQKVIDMTGSQPKQVDQLQVDSSNIYSNEDIRLLNDIGKYEKIYLEEELLELNHQLKAMEIQHQTVEDEFKSANMELELVQKIEQAIQKCYQFQISLSSEDMDSLSVYDFHLQSLNNIFQEEIPSNFFSTVQHQLSETAVACIIPSFKRILAQWNPLEDNLSSVQEFFIKYQNLFYTADTLYLSPKNNSTQETIWDRDSGTTPMTPYDSLIYHIWLPRVRSTLINQWKPEDYEPAIRLFEIWKPPTLISSHIFDLLINQSIIPKMKQSIESWNPKKNATSLELWIHPWLPLVHSHFDPLYDTIRSKLGLTLNNWQPKDPIGINIVSTWQTVFNQKDMTKLIDRSIVPKLFEMIKFDLIIDPSDQNLTPIKDLFHWHTHVGDNNTEKILKDAFFPKFFDVLRQWLDSEGDLEEVFEWIKYWKTLFPETILSLGGIDHSFRFALDLLNESVDKLIQ